MVVYKSGVCPKLSAYNMISRLRLFSLSIMPMWLLLFIKTINIPCYFGNDWQFVGWYTILSISNSVAVFSLVLIIQSALYCYHLCYRLKGSPDSLPVKIISSEPKNIDYINTFANLMTLFSVLLIDYRSIRDVFLLVILLVVIYVFYTRTNLYYCNIMFALMQFSIVQVNTNGNKKLPDNSIVLFRGKLKERVEPYHLADNIYISI